MIAASFQRLRSPNFFSLAISLALVFVFVPTPTPSAMAQAAGDRSPLAFESAAEEQRFHALVAELRCVMCQNQSLADSDAQIAKDLRREVLRLMREGRSDEDIRGFLVARYGEFVLYRPRVSSATWLLWFGPLVVVLIGATVAIRSARSSTRTRGGVADDDAQEW
jgi:cytochrome c-type biogenesis protein CcmH